MCSFGGIGEQGGVCARNRAKRRRQKRLFNICRQKEQVSKGGAKGRVGRDFSLIDS
jgi:hypothetical protein